jgi:hypothetical protein
MPYHAGTKEQMWNTLDSVSLQHRSCPKGVKPNPVLLLGTSCNWETKQYRITRL